MGRAQVVYLHSNLSVVCAFRRHDVAHGSMGQNVSKDFECDDGGQDPEGDALDDAMFVCATFVGRTLFMGYDTGYIWAHRVSDGRRLYR